MTCETAVGSSGAAGGPVGEELSSRFGKGEDGRQTDQGLNEAVVEMTEKRVRTIGLWIRSHGANQSRNGSSGGFSECSTSRNDEGTTEGGRNNGVVMSIRLSVSRHARVAV